MIEQYNCKIHGIVTDGDICREKNKEKIRLRCRICKNEIRSLWRINNREQHRATANRARDLNPVKRNAYERSLYKKNIQKERTRSVIRNKNITREEYYAMIENQNNRCKICNKNETRTGRNGTEIARLCIDHDHATGLVRALLCHDCNTGLGKFRDSITLLQRSIDYLKEHDTHDEIGGRAS